MQVPAVADRIEIAARRAHAAAAGNRRLTHRDIAMPSWLVHRGQVMRKMQASSLPDLARMADKLTYRRTSPFERRLCSPPD